MGEGGGGQGRLRVPQGTGHMELCWAHSFLSKEQQRPHPASSNPRAAMLVGKVLCVSMCAQCVCMQGACLWCALMWYV